MRSRWSRGACSAWARARPISGRSYWIPGSYAPTLSENHNSFFRLLKNKDFKEESMTKVELYVIGTSTTLESNKSLARISAWSVRSDRGHPSNRRGYPEKSENQGQRQCS